MVLAAIPSGRNMCVLHFAPSVAVCLYKMAWFSYWLLHNRTDLYVLSRRTSFRGLSSFVGASEDEGDVNDTAFQFGRVCRLSAMVRTRGLLIDACHNS